MSRITFIPPKAELGFTGITASQFSLEATQPRPDCRKPHERIEDAFARPSRPRPKRLNPSRPKPKVYVPRDGNQAGPLFGIWCRREGVRLAVCRGTIHHVMQEAQKFAESQGATLADVYVRIAQ